MATTSPAYRTNESPDSVVLPGHYRLAEPGLIFHPDRAQDRSSTRCAA